MSKKAVVAGHICLDITPAIPEQSSSKIQDILSPGRLINVGNADIHTGGSVANTGLAMKILGADVTLAGKIGQDALGDMIMQIADRYDASLGLIRSSEDSTSYSVVIAIPGVDRIFLHNPGANDTFCADDLPMDAIKEAALFHFGYPPLMKRIYENEGKELVRIMRTVKEAGTVTSLDLAAVDPDTPSGRSDWNAILSDTLPYVDIFVPSVEELMFMLERDKYERLRRDHPDRDLTEIMSLKDDIEPLGDKCLDMGAKIVLIKCGAPGMYYCTKDRSAFEGFGERLEFNVSGWAGKRGFEKSFKPEKILSGTGAGDTSVAAFLTSVLNGCSLDESVKYAVATGACCVAAYDALGGLKNFEELDQKMAAGWEKN
ncbi:MAG: carbohydrate kinase family protein [Lachnospiraceae bacterium]|nr:carbohydrate kinase family protein [Lachnospiraceae bacterium]